MSQYNIVSRQNGFPFINPQNDKTQRVLSSSPHSMILKDESHKLNIIIMENQPNNMVLTFIFSVTVATSTVHAATY